MNAAQVRAKARMAMKKREEEVEQEEMESGELNLVPYLDVVTNIVIFLLASLTAGLVLGNINSSLPEYADSASAVTGDPSDTEDEPPIQLVVAITKKNIQMFSLSGLEGTLDQPKLKIPADEPGEKYDFSRLTAAAREIVERRWASTDDRPPGSTEVILMADGQIPYKTIIAAMDALRQDPKDGKLLFPDILFSTGIQ